jgi:hypothetical protein
LCRRMDKSQYYDASSGPASTSFASVALHDPGASRKCSCDGDEDSYDALLAKKLSGQHPTTTIMADPSAAPRPTSFSARKESYVRTAPTGALAIGGKDCLWVWLYAATILAFLAVAAVNATSSPASWDVYRRFVGVIVPELKVIVLANVLLGILWSWLMSWCARPLIYGMLLFVPTLLVLCAVVLLWTMHLASCLLALLLLLGALGLLKLVRCNQDAIQDTIRIVQCSATVLRKHPQVHVFTVGLAIFYTFLVFVWLLLFAQVVSGRILSGPYPTGLSILALVWTGSLLGNYQRALIAKTVHNWYFFDSSSSSSSSSVHNTKSMNGGKRTAILFEPSKYAGQFALAALVLSVTDVLRLTNWSLRRLLERLFPPGSLVRPVINVGLAVSSALEQWLSRFTAFAVLDVVLSEGRYSLWTSSRQVWSLFRRNLLLTAVNDLTVTVVFTVTGGLTALMTGVLWPVIVDGSSPLFSHWFTPLVIALITFGLLRFFITTYTAAIDASFLCYALDLDDAAGSKNCEDVIKRTRGMALEDPARLALYQAFAAKLSQLPK